MIGFVIRNPLAALLGLAVACLVMSLGYNAILGSRLEYATQRAVLAEKDLKAARERAAAIEKAEVERAAEEAAEDKRRETVRRAVDAHRNTSSDRNIGPVLKDYLKAVGGPK